MNKKVILALSLVCLSISIAFLIVAPIASSPVSTINLKPDKMKFQLCGDSIDTPGYPGLESGNSTER